MSKHTRTTRHLASEHAPDGVTYVPSGTFRDPTFVPRLTWSILPEKVEYDATRLWTGVGTAPRDVEFFCDSNLFHDNAPPEMSEALLHGEPDTHVTPRVREELIPWLEQRTHHPLVRALSEGRTRLSVVSPADWNDPQRHAFVHYVQLLAARKLMMAWAEGEHERKLGRPLEEADRPAVRATVQAALGERGYLFAKKGASEQAKGTRSSADEETVYCAIAHALRTGRQTVILTRDEDLIDQFYRLIYLLDTHYRSMLIAETYQREFGSFRMHPMPKGGNYVDAFAANNNVLVEYDEDLPHRVLPDAFSFVAVSCWLVGDRYLKLTFGAEREMMRLVELKGRTRGMNTDLLSPRNCHLALVGLPPPRRDMPPCFAIAQDRTHDVSSQRIPHIEFMQAIAVKEGFKGLEESRLVVPG
jgi:hypothetical protein